MRIINEGKEILGADWIKQEYKIDVTKAGNYVQKVPGPILDIAGITLAPVALSAGLLGAPAFITGGIFVTNLALGASTVGKILFDYKEEKISKKEAIISSAFFIGGAANSKIFKNQRFIQYNVSKTLFVGQKIGESDKKPESKTNND